MSIEAVRQYLNEYGLDHDILEFPGSSATVALAAQAAGVIPARITKSLSFRHEDGCVLIAAAGDAKVDNAKFKAQFGHKASMLSPEDAIRLTSHAVGGVGPFAVGQKAEVFLDVSLRRFQTVFPACGSSISAIEISPEDLFKISHAKAWIDVCKNWRQDTEGE